ncbi:MAG: hypothetical protein M1827_005148 [Pycnora praestabilis]|nr:MAG: hypothetical protein M1827_005148 [Pycnora praestabilis]
MESIQRLMDPGQIEAVLAPRGSSFEEYEESSVEGKWDGACELNAGLEYTPSSVESSGSFACSSVSLEIINPGLTVKGLGSVGLPLSEKDAMAIKDLSHGAPFGKDHETIIDTSLTGTWELNANQPETCDLAWQRYLQTVASAAGQVFV